LPQNPIQYGFFRVPCKQVVPLKRLHFSTSNDAGPASGAQRKADSLADTAAAPGDYGGSHVV
jgi:hypothetical protein